MGKAWLSRYNNRANRWTDGECKKHRHSFAQTVVIHIVGAEKSKHYFNAGYYIANKCEHCRSFRNARFICDDELENYKDLQVYEFISHKQVVGFESITPAK